jgi:hypothetical protein
MNTSLSLQNHLKITAIKLTCRSRVLIRKIKGALLSEQGVLGQSKVQLASEDLLRR